MLVNEDGPSTSVDARPEVIAMSALRAHGSERTEGIGPAPHLNGNADEEATRAKSVDGCERVEPGPSNGSARESQFGRGEAESGDVSWVQPSTTPESAVPKSVSGVASNAAVSAGNAVSRRTAARNQSGEQSRPSNARAQSFHRYLSAQSDIDEEVIRLYKLVCRV